MRNFFLTLVPLIGLVTLSHPASAQPQLDMFSKTPGTYKTVNVGSQEDCQQLCENDWPTCRGVIAFQADITQPFYECRLNNGLDSGSPFEAKPPAPLDLERALTELNAYRAQNGLGALRLNDKLNKASEVHARDLADHGIAAHEGTDGSTHAERITRQGYKWAFAGENVATGQQSWETVFKAWQDSPGHNENLLQPDVSDFGVALIFEPNTAYTTYWAMLVAKPAS